MSSQYGQVNPPKPLPRTSDGLNKDETTGDKFSSDALYLGIIVGSCVIGAALVIIIIVMITKKCTSNQRHKLINLGLSDDRHTICTSRSAPSTRSSSPYRVLDNQKAAKTSPPSPDNGRSVTMQTIPDFNLPQELVQPPTPGLNDNGNSDFLHFHSTLIGNLKQDHYGSLSYDGDSDSLQEGTTGQMWFTAVYDVGVEELRINLIKATNLRVRRTGTPHRDPFVKLYLLPDERTCLQSKIIKRTLAPKFNQTFSFKVQATDILNRTLRMSMYDVDKRRVRHTLGHVFVTMDELDLTKEEIIIRDLETATNMAAGLGEVNVQLTYTATNDRLRVSVLRARNLKKFDFDSGTGVYVRVQLNFGQRTQKTRKTCVQNDTTDPVFNENFAFNVKPKQLESCSVRIILMAQSTAKQTAHEQEYGRAVIGSYMHARGEELAHWQDMLASPRQPVTRWLMLNSESNNRFKE